MEKSKSDFYVYAWLRPCGTPFYIGKGRGRRLLVATGRNPIFSRIVEKTLRSGTTPRSVILFGDLTESRAFAIERAEIAKYGRMNNGTGILANLTDGGEGVSGSVIAAKTCEKLSRANRHKAAISGLKGAFFNASTQKWRAAIRDSKGQVHLGVFDTEEEAGRAYDAAAFALWGGDCYLNFPDDVSLVPISGISKSKSSRLAAPKRDGLKGVTLHKATGSWVARIDLDGGRKVIGYFQTEVDAALAYDSAAYSEFGDDCYINYPDRLGEPPPVGRDRAAAKRFRPPVGDFKGVSVHKPGRVWRAKIQVDGSPVCLGLHASPQDAARAYDAAAFAAWGRECYLNFPSGVDGVDRVAET